jgi:hypothetical protein
MRYAYIGVRRIERVVGVLAFCEAAILWCTKEMFEGTWEYSPVARLFLVIK